MLDDSDKVYVVRDADSDTMWVEAIFKQKECAEFFCSKGARRTIEEWIVF